MLELEHLAISELDLTEDMMTENVATAIAQTARKLATLNRQNASSSPTKYPLVVILAGNHKTGSRAIAAARQLRNHNAQVILCVLGLNRESDLLDSVRRQLTIYRKRGGEAIGEIELAETLNQFRPAAGRKTRRRHPDANLIIDAILGIHFSFDDLRAEDQAGYAEIVRWANGSDAVTVSIDIPSGVDSSTGRFPSHLYASDSHLTGHTGEGPDESHLARLKLEPATPGIVRQDPSLVIAADHVLSLGAPKNGLVLGREKVESFKHHLSWLIADIGLDITAWKKSGLRGGKGPDFGSEWVTALELIPVPEP